jgi:hypothetical protein
MLEEALNNFEIQSNEKKKEKEFSKRISFCKNKRMVGSQIISKEIFSFYNFLSFLSVLL